MKVLTIIFHSYLNVCDYLGAFGKVRLARKLKDSGDSSTDEDSMSEENRSLGSSPKKWQLRSYSLDFRKEREPTLYAVKILSKHMIIQAKQIDHVYNEMVL